MPFYEYECASCKFYAEVMQKITDAPLTKCPSCGKKALKKLVSAPNFRLKGGGWYETDFKGDPEKRRNLAEAEKDEAPKTDAPKADAKAEPAKADAAAGATAKETPKADTAKADAKSTASGAKSAGRKPAGRGARTKPVRAAAKQARSPKGKSTARGRTRR